MMQKILMLGLVIVLIATGAGAEELSVFARGPAVMSDPLVLGQWYIIEARGFYGYKNTDVEKIADAEWVQTYINDEWTWIETTRMSDLDLHINNADISMMGTEDGVTFLPHVYSPDHIYRASVFGRGEAIELSIYDTEPGDNSGALEVTIRPALSGDTNLDDVVDAQDVNNLMSQFGRPPDEYNADFNGDGIVDLADFVIQRQNFGVNQFITQSPETGSAAPEPTTLILLAFGLPLLIKQRKP